MSGELSQEQGLEHRPWFEQPCLLGVGRSTYLQYALNIFIHHIIMLQMKLVAARY